MTISCIQQTALNNYFCTLEMPWRYKSFDHTENCSNILYWLNKLNLSSKIENMIQTLKITIQTLL